MGSLGKPELAWPPPSINHCSIFCREGVTVLIVICQVENTQSVVQKPDLLNTCICKRCTFTVEGKGRKMGFFGDAAAGPSAKCPELLPVLPAVGFPLQRGNHSKTNEAI